MCGITGFFAREQLVGPWFAEATFLGAHRGPDANGCWIPGWREHRPLRALEDGPPESSRAALGLLRLAILDLNPAAGQPMVAPDRAALSFNGEIYNYVELRGALAARGWRFRSSGDTEVLLKGWLEWGLDLLPRLNGMWAFAIYDQRRRGLLLCRDRFGEKPLFWTTWRGGVAFASEIKQLAGFPGVELRLDPARAAGYLTTGRPYDGASSWFSSIHQLEPATWMWIDADGRRMGRYFDLEQEVRGVEVPATSAACIERFAGELSDSVRLRLRSDVPVGTSLSGGVDSSAVMAEATAQGLRGHQSFTFGSDDRDVDESRQAAGFAVAMGSTWHGITGSGAEFAALWDRMTWHQECPIPSTSLYGQWKVHAEARAAGVIVLLDGQGADEILGGYHRFYAALVWDALRRRSPRTVPLLLGFGRQVGSVRTLRDHGHRYLGRLAGAPAPGDYVRGGLAERTRHPAVRVDALTVRLNDIARWSLPNLLSYVDRNAMAHSVETRLPFLDPRLAALALALPPDLLVRGGWTKWPLRRVLAARDGDAPARRRGKRWFGVPQSAWLRGPLGVHLQAFRHDPHPAWSEMADPQALRRVVDLWDARRPSAPWDDRIFEMLSLERFLRVWFPVSHDTSPEYAPSCSARSPVVRSGPGRAT